MGVERNLGTLFFLRNLSRTPLETFPQESFETSKNFKTKYGGNVLNYYQSKRDNPGYYFPMPKSIFWLGLSSGEIVYTYLMYCEDRKTFQCHPSYSTIGKAAGMSNNTVKKYVDTLERKGLIRTEHTTVKTRDGRTHNGSLLYTLLPLKPIEEAFFERKLREAEARFHVQTALEKYDRKTC